MPFPFFQRSSIFTTSPFSVEAKKRCLDSSLMYDVMVYDSFGCFSV